jgi:hypothetical protein
VNALLTFPFGVLALLVPAAIFAPFGIRVDAGDALIARGYGATLVAYGWVLFGLRDVREPVTVRVLLVSMTLFNVVEATVQGIAGISGVAESAIWGTVGVHCAVAIWCLVHIARARKAGDW